VAELLQARCTFCWPAGVGPSSAHRYPRRRLPRKLLEKILYRPDSVYIAMH